jgi:hypothetical protein
MDSDLLILRTCKRNQDLGSGGKEPHLADDGGQPHVGGGVEEHLAGGLEE